MSDTPWEAARRRLSSTKPKHQRSEERGATGGGKMQVNSGRFWFSKRDFKKFFFLFENRQTDADSYTIKRKELKKITKEAIFENALPAMRIDFSSDGDWVLIRGIDFQDFYEVYNLMEALLVAERDERKTKNQSDEG